VVELGIDGSLSSFNISWVALKTLIWSAVDVVSENVFIPTFNFDTSTLVDLDTTYETQTDEMLECSKVCVVSAIMEDNVNNDSSSPVNDESHNITRPSQVSQKTRRRHRNW
jgi:hypothetical protein